MKSNFKIKNIIFFIILFILDINKYNIINKIFFFFCNNIKTFLL